MKDKREHVARAMWKSRNGTDMDDAVSPSLVEIYLGLADAAIAALEPAPVSVQEAAVFLAEHIDKDMAAANHIIDAYVNVTPKTPVRHWLSQCLRALAEKGEA